MIITFCGHSNIDMAKEYILEEKILKIFSELKDEVIDFYLGGYGDFDNLAKRCCDKYKQLIKKIRLLRGVKLNQSL